MATEKLSSVHPRLVLAVGRVVPYKGFEVLIEALAGLDATAMIFGDGRQAKRLQTTRHRTPNDRPGVFHREHAEVPSKEFIELG